MISGTLLNHRDEKLPVFFSGMEILSRIFSGYETGNFGNLDRKSVQICEIDVKSLQFSV